MSMRDSLNKWLVGHSETSVMHQLEETIERISGNKPVAEPGSVCEQIPEQTKSIMMDMARESMNENLEKGAAILEGYQMGVATTGDKNDVRVIRLPGTIGTYHTHTNGLTPKPSVLDIMESMAKDDRVMCLGSEGKIGTRIACYTPVEPLWSGYRKQMIDLIKDIQTWNNKVTQGRRIRKVPLKRLLRYLASPQYMNYARMLKPSDIPNLVAEAERKEQLAVNLVEASEIAEQKEKQAKEEVDNAQRDLDAIIESAIPVPNSFITVGTRVWIISGGRANQMGSIDQMLEESVFTETMVQKPGSEIIERHGNMVMRFFHAPPGMITGSRIITTGRILYRIKVDQETITLEPKQFALLSLDVAEAKMKLDSMKQEHVLSQTAIRISRQIADDAITNAEIARIASDIDPDQFGRVQEAANEAMKQLAEGSELELRRRQLIDDLDREILLTGYKPEFLPQVKVNDEWQPMKIAIGKCKVQWDTIGGDLPWEF